MNIFNREVNEKLHQQKYTIKNSRKIFLTLLLCKCLQVITANSNLLFCQQLYAYYYHVLCKMSVITVQQHFSRRMALYHLQQKLNFVLCCEPKTLIGQTWSQFDCLQVLCMKYRHVRCICTHKNYVQLLHENKATDKEKGQRVLLLHSIKN